MRRWIGFGIAFALVAIAILHRLDVIADPIPKLAGTAAWTTSRAAGVTAFGALALDVVFGLFISTGLVDRWVPRGASVDIHRWLSSVALGFVAIHTLALLGDATVHFDALDALIPGLSTYRPGAIAIGVISTYGAVVVHASFGWRKHIGVRAWRALHGTAFAIFVGAATHGMLAGTDALHLHAFYGGSLAIVIALLVVRIAMPRRSITA